MLKLLGRNNRLLMLALFIWALGEGLWYQNLRTLYLQELGAAAVQIGLADAISFAARSIPLIPTGYLGDRFGPYRILLASWGLGIVGAAVLALAPNWEWAVPGLVIYSLSAFAIPSVNAYALLNIPDKTLSGIQQRTITAIYAAYAAGLIVSPLLGGWIAQQAGTIRISVGIGTVIFGFSLLAVLFAKHVPPAEAHHEERPRDLLRNRAYLTLAVYFALTVFVFQVMVAFVPNFLQAVRELDYFDIGKLYAVSSLGTVLISLLVGRLDRRWNYALILVLVGLAGIGIWQGRGVVLPFAFFGMGAIWSARTLAAAGAASAVRPRNRGLALGLMETLFALSMALASGVAGRLYDQTPTHHLPFVVALGGLAALFFVWFAVRSALKAGDRLNESAQTTPAVDTIRS